jgi:hypothetical protein
MRKVTVKSMTTTKQRVEAQMRENGISNDDLP